jgi:hypothetical protein
MLTGLSALRNIDQSLQTIRNEVVHMDRQLGQLSSKMASNQRHRAKLINDIAGVRLAEIESGQLSASFTAADQQAAEILAQRSKALSDLSLSIDHTNQRIVEAEAQRDSLLETANYTSAKIVDIEGQVQQQLKADQAYMKQFELAKQAESVAEEAQHKTQRAQVDMADKAAPYETDELFMYLWSRGYGTTEYQAGLLARLIDGWVARLIKYEASRVNYWNLVEIPRRLHQHAEGVGDAADQQHSALQQLELNALEAAGSKSLEAELQLLRLSLDAHDDTIEVVEAKLNDYLDQRALYMAGEDDYIKLCLQRLSSSLEHQNLQAIHHYVSATVSPTDDRMVIELQVLDDSLQDVDGDLADLRKLHDRKLNRLKELEKVRRDFKNSRFDDVRSGFGNQALIGNVLSQFIQGAVSGSDVWGVIKRNQRYRQVASTPDFGSGGLGEIADAIGGEIMRQRRSSRGSSWHWPKPRGGGGFKTGGGF